jgi:hypothetical protein
MSAPEGKTYFTVFAGRRRFLSILMTYVHPLLDARAVDTVHLWDYTRLPADREYVKTLADAARGVHVLTPPESDRGARFPNKWKGYYAHYAAALGPRDLLVKCDDDIVFLANLPVLLAAARADAEGAHLLYYPSIVNNDVAAAFQAADGVLVDPDFVVGLRRRSPRAVSRARQSPAGSTARRAPSTCTRRSSRGRTPSSPAACTSGPCPPACRSTSSPCAAPPSASTLARTPQSNLSTSRTSRRSSRSGRACRRCS